VPSADTAKLVAQLLLDDRQFTGAIKRATDSVGKLEKTSDRAYRAGTQIGTGLKNAGRLAAGGAAFLVANIGLGLNSLVELEQQTAQTNAVIKSTGGVAGVTADDVGRLAEKYEALNATIGDETIRESQNLLLTFTNVRKEAFEPALQAILDMNTALGRGPEGLTQTTTMVAKALQDPVRGLTALRRVGVNFTKDQEAQIKAMVEANDVLGAQRFILAELNTEYGGSFLAQGDTTAGKVAKFKDAIEDLQRSLAEALLPALGNVADALSTTLQDPAVIQGVKDIGVAIAGMFSKENLQAAGDTIRGTFNTIREAAPGIIAVGQQIAGVVKGAVDVFRSLPPDLQKLLVGAVAVNKLTGGLVTNLVGGGVEALFGKLRGATPATPMFVRDVGKVLPGMPGTGGGPGAGLGAVGKMFLVGEAIGLALLVNEVRNGIADGNTETARQITDSTQSFVGENKLTRDQLVSALAAVDKGIADISSNPLNALVQGEALTELQKSREILAQRLAAIETNTGVAATNTAHANVNPNQYPAPIGPPVPADIKPVYTGPNLQGALTAIAGLSELDTILQRGIEEGYRPIGEDSATTAAAVLATLKKNEAREASNLSPVANAIRDQRTAYMTQATEIGKVGSKIDRQANDARTAYQTQATGLSQIRDTLALARADAAANYMSQATGLANTAAAAQRTATETAIMRATLDRKDFSVNVPVTVNPRVYINSRQVSSTTTRTRIVARAGQAAIPS
jgi:hypothetical protein